MRPNDGVTSDRDTEMVVRILAGLAAALYSLKDFQAAGNAFGYVSGLITAYRKIPYVFYLLGSIPALLSCMAMALTLALFAWRRRKENTGEMFFMVGTAGAVRIAAVFLKMILTYAGRIARGSYLSLSPFITFTKEVIYSAIVVCALFAILYASGDLIFVKKSSDELIQMLKSMPDFVKNELNQASGPAELPDQPEKLQTDRSFFRIAALSFLTCGIYAFYVYYGMTKDLNIICNGDGRATTGIIPHILLDIVTVGIFEYYWQYTVAERMAETGPEYGVDIKENGRTILIWMIAGTFVFFLGTYFVMYFQIRNLNRLSEAYNRQEIGKE